MIAEPSALQSEDLADTTAIRNTLRSTLGPRKDLCHLLEITQLGGDRFCRRSTICFSVKKLIHQLLAMHRKHDVSSQGLSRACRNLIFVSVWSRQRARFVEHRNLMSKTASKPASPASLTTESPFEVKLRSPESLGSPRPDPYPRP